MFRGSEQEVYTLPTSHVWEYGGMAWTADGKNLVFPQQDGPQAPSVLVELSLDSRTVKPLSSPPQGWDGDWTPAISPDGTMLAFPRGPEGSVHDIYVMKLPDGKPQRLTFDGRLILGLTWSADGSEVVFSSNRSGNISLWRVRLKGGAPEHELFARMRDLFVVYPFDGWHVDTFGERGGYAFDGSWVDYIDGFRSFINKASAALHKRILFNAVGSLGQERIARSAADLCIPNSGTTMKPLPESS